MFHSFRTANPSIAYPPRTSFKVGGECANRSPPAPFPTRAVTHCCRSPSIGQMPLSVWNPMLSQYIQAHVQGANRKIKQPNRVESSAVHLLLRISCQLHASQREKVGVTSFGACECGCSASPWRRNLTTADVAYTNPHNLRLRCRSLSLLPHEATPFAF